MTMGVPLLSVCASAGGKQSSWSRSFLCQVLAITPFSLSLSCCALRGQGETLYIVALFSYLFLRSGYRRRHRLTGNSSSPALGQCFVQSQRPSDFFFTALKIKNCSIAFELPSCCFGHSRPFLLVFVRRGKMWLHLRSQARGDVLL